MLSNPNLRTETLRILEVDHQNGQISAQVKGNSAQTGWRVINGWLPDAKPYDYWRIEYEAEAIGDDDRGLLWLVDAEYRGKVHGRRRRIEPKQLALQLAA